MNKQDWLNSKEFLIGPFTRISKPETVEIIGLAGFDFAVVDLEHGGSVSPSEVYPLILAAERRGLRLIARVPGLQESYFKWLLDLGIGGLQIPHIKTAKDAQQAVQFARFSPEGERGLCRFVRAAEFSNIPREQYVKEANQKSLVIVQIEGREGISNIQEIASISGVDVVFIGPYDLSQSLGLIGQIWHEKVVEEMKKAVEVCARAGVAVGVFTDTLDGVKHWRSLGVKYINYRIDTEMVLNFFKNHVEEIKKLL